MQKKEHLTSEGLDQIRKIKMGMNKGREYAAVASSLSPGLGNEGTGASDR